MGGFCCTNKESTGDIDLEAPILLKETDWAQAVNSDNINAMRYIFADNPHAINDYINNHGMCAIHFAVINKNIGMLQYLLLHGANIDKPRSKDGNTGLHIASMDENVTVLRILFRYKADDTILNHKSRTAFQLCSSSFRRSFKKAKKYHLTKKFMELDSELFPDGSEEYGHLTDDKSTIAGIEIVDRQTSKKIQRYLKSLKTETNFMKQKEIEIQLRHGICVTVFGEATGIDIDEIAFTLQTISNRNKLWDKWVKALQISKFTDIYRIVFGVTLIALRKKDSKASKPEPKVIQDLTVKVCKLLPVRKRKPLLAKDDFVDNFHNLLFQIHEKLEREEIEKHAVVKDNSHTKARGLLGMVSLKGQSDTV